LTGKDKILNEGLIACKKHNYNCVVILPTGSGKGRLMIEIAKLLKPKSILYLCNTQLLRDKMFIDELHKWDAAYLLPIIDRQCYQTAFKYKDKHYDLVLADEFDAALTTEYIKVFQNNTFTYKILVSATLDDDKKYKARKIAPIAYERHQKELIQENVLNNIQFHFVNFDLNDRETHQYLEYNKRFQVLLNREQTAHTRFELERLQIQRKQFLSSLATSRTVTRWLLSVLDKKFNEKVLVFCGLSEQADAVCKHSYHSINDNNAALQAFERGEIKQLSVVDKLTRGVNISDIRHIIMESTGKSKTKITQKIGRGLRLLAHEVLNVFFLIPHFKHPIHGKKPTIVKDWIDQSTKEMDLTKCITINYVNPQ